MNWSEYASKIYTNFVERRISIEEFIKEMPKGLDILNEDIHVRMQQAIASQDSDLAGILFIALSHGKPDEIFTEQLMILLDSDWMFYKEDIITVLGEIGDCRAATILYQMIDRPVEGSYYGSHQIKCVWALGALRNCEIAGIYLQKLTESDNPAIRENALHELVRRALD